MPATRPERLVLDRLATPIGTALLVTDEAGLVRALDWADHEVRMTHLLMLHYPGLAPVEGAAPQVVRQALERYFAGALEQLGTIAWATAGTDFQRAVWQALTTIPAGRTITYAQLAQAIDRPRAVRAAGHANGANPIGVVVPCHRVIGSNGSLTGYGGGLERKRWLLRHEGVAVP